MDCRSAKKSLFLFLDNQLSCQETAHVLDHLEHCKHCVQIFEEEKNFQRLVKARSQAECCPEQLKLAIFAQIDRLEIQHPAGAPVRTDRLRPRLRQALQTAASILFGIGLFALYSAWQAGSTPISGLLYASDVARTLSTTHAMLMNDNLQLQMTGNAAELRDALKPLIQRAGSPLYICVPEGGDLDHELHGGTLLAVTPSHRMTMACYRCPTDTVSFYCFSLDPLTFDDGCKSLCHGKDVFVQEKDGNTVVIWSHGTCYHSLVGKMPRAELLALAAKLLDHQY